MFLGGSAFSAYAHSDVRQNDDATKKEQKGMIGYHKHVVHCGHRHCEHVRQRPLNNNIHFWVMDGTRIIV